MRNTSQSSIFHNLKKPFSLLFVIATLSSTAFAFPAWPPSWLPVPVGWPSALLPAQPPVPPLERLPRLHLDKARVSISGVSSGAFMAVQMHLAYSSVIKGVGSVAGGIWECAKGDSARAQNVCMQSPTQIVVKEHLDLASRRASQSEIEPLSGVRDSRVYIFASQNDMIIRPGESDKLAEFYQALVPAGSIQRASHSSATHGFLTSNYGNLCSMMGTPWLLNCGYDLAGEILTQTDPQNTALSAPGAVDNSSLVFFDQRALIGTGAVMHSWGAAYIPKACTGPSAHCGLHVALHGCQMNPDFIDRQFVDHAGFNEWAETNRLVVLYPQAEKTSDNPYGCWDWFGYTGPSYTSKSGKQIQALRALMKEIGI